VDWAAGHREKSRWAGPLGLVIFGPPGPLLNYNKLKNLRKHVVENIP